MNVLLIYNYIPENLIIYNVTVNDSEFDKLRKLHGKLQNEIEEGLSEWLKRFLEINKKYIIYDDTEPHDELLIIKECHLIYTGVAL